MSELEPIEFEIQIGASVLIDHIPTSDVEEKFIETYVSAEELSQCNRRSIVGDTIARAVDDDKIGTIYEILL